MANAVYTATRVKDGHPTVVTFQYNKGPLIDPNHCIVKMDTTKWIGMGSPETITVTLS